MTPSDVVAICVLRGVHLARTPRGTLGYAGPVDDLIKAELQRHRDDLLGLVGVCSHCRRRGAVVPPVGLQMPAGFCAHCYGAEDALVPLLVDGEPVLCWDDLPRVPQPAPVRPFPPEWRKQFPVETLERLAIMSVDGGLSDSEALCELGLLRGGDAS